MSDRGGVKQSGSTGTMRRNGVWQEFKTPAGKKYYYIKNTKESRWDKPDFKKALGVQNSAKASWQALARRGGKAGPALMQRKPASAHCAL